MFEKIINFFKRIFVKEDILKIEAPKEDVKIHKNINIFQENLKNSTNERTRLLNIQNDIKAGNITEKDLNITDINLLKKLYLEQISELATSIEYYSKRIKV